MKARDSVHSMCVFPCFIAKMEQRSLLAFPVQFNSLKRYIEQWAILLQPTALQTEAVNPNPAE